MHSVVITALVVTDCSHVLSYCCVVCCVVIYSIVITAPVLTDCSHVLSYVVSYVV